MLKFSELLLLYFPSLLIRYSVHLLTIFLPWILQLQNKPLASIADNFTYFYFGCIAGCLLFYRFTRAVRIVNILKICLFLQTGLFLATFFIEKPEILNTIRFFHGALLGIFRPANQIWVNEFESTIGKTELAQRATYSKLMVSAGLFFAGVIGSLAKYVVDTPTIAILFLVVFFGVPKSVMFYLFFWKGSFHFEPKVGVQAVGLKTREWLFWLIRHPRAFFCVCVHAVTMFAFSSWFLLVPFEIRRNAAFYGLNGNAELFLSFFLPAHSLVFSIVQWLCAKNLHKFHFKDSTNCWIMAGCLVTQAVLIFVALSFAHNPFILAGLLFLGPSGMSAVVYPVLMMILYHEVNDPQSELMRKMIIFLSFASDIGQFLGALVLGSRQLPFFLSGLNGTLAPTYLMAFISVFTFGVLGQPKVMGSLVIFFRQMHRKISQLRQKLFASKSVKNLS